MSRTMWWETGRLLERGSRGTEVSDLQRKLNREVPPPFPVSGVFDETTQNRVKTFQRRHGLLDDGTVGPVTHAVLYRSFFEFAIEKPPRVQQPLFRCWAAALESVLKSTWRGRPALRVDDLVSRYRQFLRDRGEITIQGFEQAAIDLRFGGKRLRGQDVRLEKVLSLLRTFRVHLLFVHDLTRLLVNDNNVTAHTEVVYGVRVQAGIPQLLVMDPEHGDYNVEELPAVHRHAQQVLLLAPGETGQGRF